MSDDSVTPPPQSVAMFERAGQPVDLILLSGIDHWPFAGNAPRTTHRTNPEKLARYLLPAD